MAETVYTATGEAGREGRITIVPSLTSTRAYKVTSDSCSCPHFEHTGAFCKHRVLRPALERIRSLARPEATREMIEERVLDLARRIYARPRASETASQSYDLYYEALTERYASEALRERAHARHRLVVERCFERMAA